MREMRDRAHWGNPTDLVTYQVPSHLEGYEYDFLRGRMVHRERTCLFQRKTIGMSTLSNALRH